jgi:plasmid stabilization system protein ParE
MTVEVHDEAEQELREAFDWYEAQRQGLGDEFVEEFRRAVARIIAFPRAWQRLSKRTRRCRLNRFPYGVVYQLRREAILIVAVIHLHRRPGYWRGRRS